MASINDTFSITSSQPHNDMWDTNFDLFIDFNQTSALTDNTFDDIFVQFCPELEAPSLDHEAPSLDHQLATKTLSSSGDSNSPITTPSTAEKLLQPVESAGTSFESRVAGTGQMEEENQLRYLRRKLQNGLLIKGQLPKAEDMDAMSSFMEDLERMKRPPATVLRTTSILKLLRKISKADNIPREADLHIQDRAAKLREKWETAIHSLGILAPPVTPQSSEETWAPLIDLTLSEELEDYLQLRDNYKTPKLGVFTTSATPSSPIIDTVPGLRKRKRSKDKIDDTFVSNSSPGNGEKCSNRRSIRSKKFVKYKNDECQWLQETLEDYNLLIKEKDDEIQMLLEKKARLIKRKEAVLAWGAQDKKVTREFEDLN